MDIGAFLTNLVAACIGGGFVLAGTKWNAKLTQEAASHQRDLERQEREQERKQQNFNVRTLIRLELEHNVRTFREHWQRVTEIEEGDYDTQGFQNRRRLVELPLPSWSRVMWVSQALQLPSALTEEEITHVHILHTSIESFAAYRLKLSETFDYALAKQYNEYKRLPHPQRTMEVREAMTVLLRGYIISTLTLWGPCEALAGQIGREWDQLAATLRVDSTA